MAIVKCTHCSFIREVAQQHEGKQVKCPACQTMLYVQNTLFLVKDLSEEVSQLHQQILQLKQEERLARDALVRTHAQQIQQLQQQLAQTTQKSPPSVEPSDKKEKLEVRTGYAFANLSASPIFENYSNIIEWFRARQIKVDVDKSRMDISGFFDEIAVKLGDNYAVLSELSERIKKAQSRHNQVTLNLANRSQKDSQLIVSFVKELHDNAFITRYTHDKTNKRVHLSLQTVPTIINFFNGDWLEWYALMKVATLLLDKKVQFSCLRGFHVQFPNEDKHEIDLFFLINGIPLWIECKSGEFRQFIGKYTTLRNRLKLDKSQALLLVLGLADSKVAGLTNTFELTLVNENSFLLHVTQRIEDSQVKRSLFKK